MIDSTERDAAADLARALNAADVDYSAREHRADAGDGEMEPGDWFTFIARAALAWMRENGYEKREAVIRCDYCGDALPSVASPADIPTTPDLQRRGFAADKVVCPACATRQDATR